MAYIPSKSGGSNFSNISSQIWGKFGEEWSWNESIMLSNKGIMAKNVRGVHL
jgi:hypothetical protein